MTDYGQGAEPFEPEKPQGHEPDEISTEDGLVTEDTSDFSSGEGMVAVGGLILLVVWFVFEIIANEYGVPTIAVVLAVAAAALPRMDPDAINRIISLPVAMKIIGYALAIIGVTEIIDDLRFGVLTESGLALLAGLIAYGGYALAFLGARSIET